MQAGFIGYWGEWHTSSNQLDRPESEDRVVRALLAALPPSIPLQLRYLEDIERLFPQPLTASQAFSGSSQARIGHHNDCFLAGENDAGTYSWNQWDRQKAYLDQISRFVPVAGETCQVNFGQARQSCTVTLAELRRFNWQVISGTWYRPVLDRWGQEGCYDEVAPRLGSLPFGKGHNSRAAGPRGAFPDGSGNRKRWLWQPHPAQACTHYPA